MFQLVIFYVSGMDWNIVLWILYILNSFLYLSSINVVFGLYTHNIFALSLAS